MQQNNTSAMSFQGRAELGMENLSKQLPVSLDQAKKQIEFLKANSKSKNKKHRA
jgi:hypothetical protein